MRKKIVLGWLLFAAFYYPPQAQAVTPKQKPYRIVMVVFRGCEDACKGFKEYWVARKIPVEIEVLDAATDVKKLPGFVTHVRASKPDLLVTWGTTVALQMLGSYDKLDPARHITDIPSLFMIASTPVGSKLVRDLNSSGRNITGTLYLVPLETQLRAARLYMPFKRVGFIHNPSENNSNVVREELLALTKKFNFSLIERIVPVDSAGKPNKERLPHLVSELADEKVDLLYLSPDTFLLLNRDAITQTATARNLPVLAAAEAAVRESDALMGVVNRYYTTGQLTASKAEKILVDHVLPQNIPIEAPPGFTFLVNMRVAKALQRYPPIRVVKIAAIVP
ncbi:MAG: ABC transporter substrate-binding protein [Pseudomonadota bacterium]